MTATVVTYGAAGGTKYSGYGPLHSDSHSFPAGRAMGNGTTAALITALGAGISGHGAAVTCSLSMGSVSTSAFGIGAGSSGPGMVWVSASGLVNGGSAPIYVNYSSGNVNVSASGSGDTYDANGLLGTAAAMYCGYQYVLPPTAPTIGTVTSTALGSATVAFTPSSDDGGSAIETYRVEYSTDNFATIAGYAESTSSPVTITGLTPGVVYYFRVAARNAVTDAAATVGAYSAIGSVSVIGGVKVGKAGAWVMCAVYVGVNGQWVPAEVFAGRAGAWVGLTN